MLDRIVERFEDAYGEHAEDRLVEVDEILGAKSATEEAYPNLRAFIEGDLFAYHANRMQNTPIIWRLTTERLITDSTAEGFACFIDYHSLDSGLFDRLVNQYLDQPRKAELLAVPTRLSTIEQAGVRTIYDRSNRREGRSPTGNDDAVPRTDWPRRSTPSKRRKDGNW